VSTDQPTTTLKIGSSLNPDDIKEGDDAYFECIVLANPKPYKMSWFHNVSMSPNIGCKIIKSLGENTILKRF